MSRKSRWQEKRMAALGTRVLDLEQNLKAVWDNIFPLQQVSCEVCHKCGHKQDMAKMHGRDVGRQQDHDYYVHPQCVPGTVWDRRRGGRNGD